MKRMILAFLVCCYLTACSSNTDIYFFGDTKLIFYKNDKDSIYKDCEIEPHDELNNFICKYEKNNKEIILHLTINDNQYKESCKIDKKKLICDNLGTFEK